MGVKFDVGSMNELVKLLMATHREGMCAQLSHYVTVLGTLSNNMQDGLGGTIKRNARKQSVCNGFDVEA